VHDRVGRGGHDDPARAALEGRCVTRGTTPEQLTAQIAALLETLPTRPGITFLRATLFYV
jgi:hypothetical protein